MDTTVTIPSRSSDADYIRPDFWEAVAFRGACSTNGIPLDKPIPFEAFQMASHAWHARNEDGAGAALWVAAREMALATRRIAA